MTKKTAKHYSVPKNCVDTFFKEVGNFTLLSRTFVVKECSEIYIHCHRDCAGIRINMKFVGVKLWCKSVFMTKLCFLRFLQKRVTTSQSTSINSSPKVYPGKVSAGLPSPQNIKRLTRVTHVGNWPTKHLQSSVWMDLNIGILVCLKTILAGVFLIRIWIWYKYHTSTIRPLNIFCAIRECPHLLTKLRIY